MTKNDTTKDNDRPLQRTHDGRMVAGVASGLAEYFDIDVTVVRLAFAAFTLLGGAGIPLYGAAWLFIPDEGGESIAADLLHRHQVA